MLLLTKKSSSSVNISTQSGDCMTLVLENVSGPIQYQEDRHPKLTLNLHLTQQQTKAILGIEEEIKHKLVSDIQVLANVKMTPLTITRYFKSTIDGNMFKVSIPDVTKIQVFDALKNPIPNDNVLHHLESTCQFNVLIQPSHVWLFKNKIGVYWIVHQIKFLSQLESTQPGWSLEVSDDDYA